MSELRIHLEFSGGAELLVGKTKHHDIALPHQPHPWSLRQLIAWIRDNLLKVNLCCDTNTPGRLSNCKLDLLLLPTSQFAIFISGGSRGGSLGSAEPPFLSFCTHALLTSCEHTSAVENVLDSGTPSFKILDPPLPTILLHLNLT